LSIVVLRHALHQKGPPRTQVLDLLLNVSPTLASM
jgi:hypothetical protein